VRAVLWHGKRDVRVDTVPGPRISEPTDAIIRVTTTNICGSDLHLYEPLAPFMCEGDILGHEPMGIVDEVGSAVPNLKVGDRVVIPFQIACGSCWMCARACRRSARPPRSVSTGREPRCSALQAVRRSAGRPGGDIFQHKQDGAIKVLLTP